MPERPLLEICDLVVRYGPHTVLNGASLKASRAERIALLGPSGSGKTTLLRSINGFVPAACGSVRVDGVEVTSLRGQHLRALRSRVGVVSQRHDLIEMLLAYQNVMAGALGRWSNWRALRFLLYPRASELEEARSALRRVDLEHKLRARTARLSGGEHQRIAIARALVQNPLLLLADEPIASLDPELSEQTLALLCGLAHESGVTLICTLHQPLLAERFFDRILELRNGRIEAERNGNGSRAGRESGLALARGQA
ncbi:MAG: ATP-binding cassette domain-containing protein [Acidobacteriaceae bacterium]|nr:ATP-binding cassette domain-containing protein [Acidobacteriaceae bacterium]